MANYDGTPGDDIIHGDQTASLADIIKGLAGNDTLYGGADADVLYGGDGQDRLEGGAGQDVLYGGDTDAAADILVGGADKDRLYGGGGDDQIVINASAEAAPSEQWYGGAGYDTVMLSSSITSLDLRGLTIGSDIEAIEGGRAISMKAAQLDALTYFHSLDGVVTLTDGGSVNLNGMTGTPTAIYLSAAGNSIIQDGPYYTTAIYGGAGDDSIETPGALYGGGGDDILRNVGSFYEGPLYGGDGDDVIFASSFNAYYGGHGSDTFYALGGYNVFFPGEDGDVNDIEHIYGGVSGDGSELRLTDDAIDLSKWTIVNVDKLYNNAATRMTTAQFNGFLYLETFWVTLTTGGAVTFGPTKGYISELNLSDFGNSVNAADAVFDIIRGGARNDTIIANGGSNQLYGGGGNDVIYGGDGDDEIHDSGGSDILSGGAGQYDTLIYDDATGPLTINLSLTTAQNTRGSGQDTISGFELFVFGHYNDTITGSAIAEQMSGMDGNDVIDGGAGDDSIDGGAGNDTVIGGLGDDGLSGGDGIDTVSYASATAAVTVSLATSNPQNTGGAGTDGLYLFENLIGSAYGDMLTGDGGNNSLYGGAGDDLLRPGLGNDTVDGGAGSDTISYDDAGAGVTVSLAQPSSQDTHAAGIDIVKNVEHVTGSSFADTLTGNAAANILTGGAGDDMLNGGAGNDSLYGGAGIDTASYATATAAVRVSLLIPGQQGTGGGGGDTLSGIENLMGGAYDDQLTGDAGNNVLTGNAGNDLLIGGLGNDQLYGGAGIDTASYAGAASGVTINLTLTAAQNTGGAGLDSFLSIENVTGSGFDDVITGTAQANAILGGKGNDLIDAGSSNDSVDGGYGDDILKGAAGDDILIGNIGADTLSGGAGADTLTGGAQNDRFVYAALTDSTLAASDRITDFTKGDILDLSAIDASSKVAGNQAFVQAAAFTHMAGEFTLAYDAGSNTTAALFDTDGDASANMAILFTGNVTTLTSTWLL